MSEKHAALVGLPAGHSLKQTGTSSEQRRGQDADIYTYDELNEAGERIGGYEVKVSMSIYPPFKTSTSFDKTS